MTPALCPTTRCGSLLPSQSSLLHCTHCPNAMFCSNLRDVAQPLPKAWNSLPGFSVYLNLLNSWQAPQSPPAPGTLAQPLLTLRKPPLSPGWTLGHVGTLKAAVTGMHPQISWLFHWFDMSTGPLDESDMGQRLTTTG